jgi:molybdopterin-guanine dinucleotide biosynthesis protein A
MVSVIGENTGSAISLLLSPLNSILSQKPARAHLMPPNPADRGAVILCGGASRRMQLEKASLPIGDETLLERTARLIGAAVPLDHMVIVAARQQRLPRLPEAIAITRDAEDHAGPLTALAAGLAALPSDVKLAFACGCDAPLLRPAVIAFLLDRLEASTADAVVPVDPERLYPLVAAYRVSCVGMLEQSLRAGESSIHRALRSRPIDLCELPIDALRSIDPQLESLAACNTPRDYAAVLSRAGRA